MSNLGRPPRGSEREERQGRARVYRKLDHLLAKEASADSSAKGSNANVESDKKDKSASQLSWNEPRAEGGKKDLWL